MSQLAIDNQQLRIAESATRTVVPSPAASMHRRCQNENDC